MGHNEWAWLDGHEMARRIRRRELSPLELVDAVLAQLDAVEPAINAFVTVTADQAREQARTATEILATRSSDDLPALFGVPITVKDLTDTMGVRTTFGARELSARVPDTDAVTWARLKRAGAILIGKTTTPEFGALGVTESALTGVTNNPWNVGYTAGGSSGGAAASVAAGVGALAWGSDGGGSIRIPASICGVVGLKPSLGRIPREQPWDSANTDGPLTRSVIDAALLLNLTAGPARTDPLSLPSPPVDYLTAARSPIDLRGMRIAYAPNPGGARVAAEVQATVAAAVDRLAEAGAEVEAVDLPVPDPVRYFLDFWGPILEGDAGGADLPHPAMRELLRNAGTAADHLQAATVRRAEITRAYNRVFDDFAFLLTPTMPVAPFPHPGAAGGNEDIDGRPVEFPYIDFHRFTESPTHAGLPAMSLPAGFSAAGLPIGIQVIGRHLDDYGVISLAAAFEEIAPWAHHRPALAI